MRYHLLVVIPYVILVQGCLHHGSGRTLQRAAHIYLSTTPEDLRIVSAPALIEHLASGKGRDLVIVDTRSAPEYEAGHIPGALHIPFRAAAERDTLERLPKGRRIVIVCKSGHTASMLNAIYNMMGYEAVTLKDGMKGWQEAGGPLVSGPRIE